MEILNTSLHQIDHVSKSTISVDLDTQGDDLKKYTEKLIEDIQGSKTKRSFLFRRESTEFYAAVQEMLSGDFPKGSSTNAARLLDSEIKAQADIAHLDKEIQKGSLFQTILEIDGLKTLIISKADHNKFLDEDDFQAKNGLPWDKTTFKAFYATYNSEDIVQDIYVYDKTKRIAKYWWDSFLELNPKHTDSHNTKKALETLDMKVFNPLKNDYPADHTIIRNSAIRYFRGNDDFDIEDFLNETISNYTPVDSSFPTSNVAKKMRDLPGKWNFDTSFSIVKEDINKRCVNKIPLNDKIDLILKEDIDLNIITPFIDSEGNKYIKIRTDLGYESFKVRE